MVGLVGANHWPAGDWEWAFCARWTISGVRFAAGTDCHRLGTGGVVGQGCGYWGLLNCPKLLRPSGYCHWARILYWQLSLSQVSYLYKAGKQGVDKVQWVFVNTVRNFPFI